MSIPVLDKNHPDLRYHDIPETNWVELKKDTRPYFFNYDLKQAGDQPLHMLIHTDAHTYTCSYIHMPIHTHAHTYTCPYIHMLMYAYECIY